MTRLGALVLVLGVLLLLHGGPAATARSLDDLMTELTIVPVDPQTPPAFTVTTMDGARVTLADVKGRAVLVYFWATW